MKHRVAACWGLALPVDRLEYQRQRLRGSGVLMRACMKGFRVCSKWILLWQQMRLQNNAGDRKFTTVTSKGTLPSAHSLARQLPFHAGMEQDQSHSLIVHLYAHTWQLYYISSWTAQVSSIDHWTCLDLSGVAAHDWIDAGPRESHSGTLRISVGCSWSED